MKRILRWFGILVALLLLLLLTVPLWLDANQFRPLLQSSLTTALARDVRVGDLKLAILSGAVTADDLSIADDPSFSREPFVRAKSLKVAVDLWPFLLHRRLNVTGLSIDGPDITLLQSPAGVWNFSSLGERAAAKRSSEPAPQASAKGSLDLTVKLVRITAGRFSLGRTAGHTKPLVLEQVNAELRDFSSAASFPFSFEAKVVGGGDIKLDGQAGPIDQTDVAATPASANLKIAAFDLAGSGWTQTVPGMGGIISFDGSSQSDGKIARVKGRLKAEKLKFAKGAPAAARTLELDFAAEHDLKNLSGRLSQGDIHIGAATASLTGTYAEHGEETVLKMVLSGPNMPVAELAAMLPALGIVLPAGSSLQGGTAVVKLSMEGPADKLVTAGSLALNHATLAGFDLGKKMSMIERLAGIQAGPSTEIETFSSTVRMAPEGISADNIQFMAPAIGELTGAGTVSPANALDFKMSAKVHTAGLMAVMKDEAIPFTIGGTCADPVFRADVKAAVKDRAKTIGTKAAGSLLKGLLGGK